MKASLLGAAVGAVGSVVIFGFFDVDPPDVPGWSSLLKLVFVLLILMAMAITEFFRRRRGR